MADFEDKWSKRYAPGPGDKIGSALRHEGPLKPRLGAGVKTVRKQADTMGKLISKIEYRDRTMLGKIAAAKAKNDLQSARMLAGELSEMRKIKKMMMLVKMSLEKVDIRLSMYTDFGDVVSVIAPAIHLMRSLGGKLGRFIPEADAEINQMAETLGGFMSNTMDGDAFEMSQAYNADVESIMQEAASVATNAVGSKFPSMPADVQDVRVGEGAGQRMSMPSQDP